MNSQGAWRLYEHARTSPGGFREEIKMYDPIFWIANAAIAAAAQEAPRVWTAGLSRPRPDLEIPSRSKIYMAMISSMTPVNQNEVIPPYEPAQPPQPGQGHQSQGSGSSISSMLSTATFSTGAPLDLAAFKGAPDCVIYGFAIRPDNFLPSNAANRVAAIIEVKKTLSERTPWGHGINSTSDELSICAQLLSYAYYQTTVNRSREAIIIYWTPTVVAILGFYRCSENANAWNSIRMVGQENYDTRDQARCMALTARIGLIVNAANTLANTMANNPQAAGNKPLLTALGMQNGLDRSILSFT